MSEKGRRRRAEGGKCEAGGAVWKADGRRRAVKMRARIRRRMASAAEASQVQSDRETRLPRTIPVRKTSENHISGGCVVKRSRKDVGGFAACIDAFYHSMELDG